MDDGAGTVLRIDPARRKVVARIPVGDGPADMVFRGKRAWVINHRDLGLVAIDTATNRPRKLAKRARATRRSGSPGRRDRSG